MKYMNIIDIWLHNGLLLLRHDGTILPQINYQIDRTLFFKVNFQ